MKSSFRKCDQLKTNHRFFIEWEILHLPHSIASCSHFTKGNPCLPSKPRCLQGNDIKDSSILRKQSIQGSLQFCPRGRKLVYHQNLNTMRTWIQTTPSTCGVILSKLNIMVSLVTNLFWLLVSEN